MWIARRGWSGIWLCLALGLVATLGTATTASANASGCPITVISSGNPGSTSVGGSFIESGSITAGSSSVGQPSVPAKVVLPLRTPLLDRLKPAGRAPAVTAKVYGPPAPPRAVSCWL